MDWRSIRFDWNRARAFLVTAEEGSLTAAARALGMTQPTLGRQVAALERELGAALFERVGKGLVLTPAGAALMDHVRAMGQAATALSLTASGRATTLDGSVRITATDSFAVFLLPDIIARLHAKAPGLTVEIEASNTVADLRRREADIAIRNARPTDPDLVARQVAQAEAQLYATPDLLRRFGTPSDAAALSKMPFIGFEQNGRYIEQLASRGLHLTDANFPVVTENHIVHWAMAQRGLGVAITATGIGDADPGMCRAAAWMDPFGFQIWLVTHRELHTSRRVRLVFDHLAAEIPALTRRRPTG